MSAASTVAEVGPHLLSAVRAITDRVDSHQGLVEQSKIVTESVQKIVNALETGNGDVASAASPRADSTGGRLKSAAATLIRHRKDALDKHDGVTAMRDLEVVENTAIEIRNILKELDSDSGKKEAPAPSPAPAPIAAPAFVPLPTAAPPKESTPSSSVSLSTPEKKPGYTPSKSTPASSPSVPSSNSNPNIPAWQQKLMAKKNLNSDLTPVKRSPSSDKFAAENAAAEKAQKAAAEKAAAEKAIAEKAAAEKKAREDADKKAADKAAADRAAAEKAAAEKAAAEKALAEKASAKAAADKAAADKAVADKAAADKAAAEKKAKEEADAKVAADKAAADKAASEKKAKEEADALIAAEKAAPSPVAPEQSADKIATDKAAADKAAADRTAAEKAAADKAAADKAAADKAAADKAAADKAAADKAAADKAAADKAASDKVAAERASAEKKAKEEAEKKAAAEKKAKEEAEKKASSSLSHSHKASVTKVNETGTALSPSLQKHIGSGRMSGVKTLTVEIGAGQSAIEKCREASHGETVRYVVLKLEKEQAELVSAGDKVGTAAEDFEKLKALVNEKDPCFIFYRYKDDPESPWALISWLPESTPVKSRMLYASSVASTCVLIGAEKVSKQVAFNTLKQFVWDDFHQGEVKLKNKEDFLAEENDKALPFSDRELAQRQVDREERVARAEMGTKAKEASGFHTVAFPLAPEAEAAIKEMLAGGHTWTQLSLDAAFKTIELREKKSPAGVAALADLLQKTEPQFYLYIFKDNIPILIYYCPEKGPTIKNKMVYSTCKSTLADTILALGFPDIKKIDIRDPAELTEAELNDAYVAKASFKPSDTASETTVLAAPAKTGAARYGAPMGGFGMLAGAVANKAKKQ